MTVSDKKSGEYKVKQKLTLIIVLFSIGCLAAVLLFSANHFTPVNTAPEICTDAADTFRFTDMGNGKKHFENDVDGYFLDVPADYSVHMGHADVFALLKNDTTRIEIYREPAANQEERDIYIGYSNRFLENTADYTAEQQTTEQFGDNYAFITAWKREKITALEKDYNFFVSLDMFMEGNIFSLFIKSTEPIDKEEYAAIAASFGVMAITKEYTPPQTAAADIAARQWNKETEEFYRRCFAENTDLIWGLFDQEFCDFHFDQYQEIEERLDYDFPVMIWYNNIAPEPNFTYWHNLLNESYKRGKVLELTLQTTDAETGSGNMIYRVLNGEYDNYLDHYAQTIADFGHPVLFRLANEMNGDWCAYSGFQTGKDTLVYREFYRYVYEKFEKAGANKNVIWVWNPNGRSMPPFSWNDAFMYYPGDPYVDIVGMTAYNTGTYYAEIGERWETFHQLYADLYQQYSQRFGQPLMITEFASASAGGDKAHWISNMFQQIRFFPRIKMAVWWSYCDYDTDGTIARSYFINESEEVLDAFYKGLHHKQTRFFE